MKCNKKIFAVIMCGVMSITSVPMKAIANTYSQPDTISVSEPEIIESISDFMNSEDFINVLNNSLKFIDDSLGIQFFDTDGNLDKNKIIIIGREIETFLHYVNSELLSVKELLSNMSVVERHEIISQLETEINNTLNTDYQLNSSMVAEDIKAKDIYTIAKIVLDSNIDKNLVMSILFKLQDIARGLILEIYQNLVSQAQDISMEILEMLFENY